MKHYIPDYYFFPYQLLERTLRAKTIGQFTPTERQLFGIYLEGMTKYKNKMNIVPFTVEEAREQLFSSARVTRIRDNADYRITNILEDGRVDLVPDRQNDTPGQFSHTTSLDDLATNYYHNDGVGGYCRPDAFPKESKTMNYTPLKTQVNLTLYELLLKSDEQVKLMYTRDKDNQDYVVTDYNYDVSTDTEVWTVSSCGRYNTRALLRYFRLWETGEPIINLAEISSIRPYTFNEAAASIPFGASIRHKVSGNVWQVLAFHLDGTVKLRSVKTQERLYSDLDKLSRNYLRIYGAIIGVVETAEHLFDEPEKAEPEQDSADVVFHIKRPIIDPGQPGPKLAEVDLQFSTHPSGEPYVNANQLVQILNNGIAKITPLDLPEETEAARKFFNGKTPKVALVYRYTRKEHIVEQVDLKGNLILRRSDGELWSTTLLNLNQRFKLA